MSHTITLGNGKVVPLSEMLNSIERYNPDHLKVMEEYVEEQAAENIYDLETNLAVLKLYQFNPNTLNLEITYTILLKALTNLPHTDFILAKCLLLPQQMEDKQIKNIIFLHHRLEQCDFGYFWNKVADCPDMFSHINGFYDSIRKFVCHVVGITFQSIPKEYLVRLLGDIDDHTLHQWMKRYGWKQQGNFVFVASQDENIKTKNVTEKIEFDNLAPLMASCL
uniref:Eukaryotic translation initiation factor 3 subunit K n=1 Tax=Tabanus bromius TaxID=304241 RepID=A0A0K8TPW8_TABBR